MKRSYMFVPAVILTVVLLSVAGCTAKEAEKLKVATGTPLTAWTLQGVGAEMFTKELLDSAGV